MTQQNPIPQSGFLRLPQIIGDKKTNTPPLIPVSKTTWWTGVKSGRFPKPVKLSERTTAWRAEDIRKLIEEAA
ncbi:MAG: AlpA family phage regulatory protein [Methylomicrobium sp.]|nr:AlpA family phage regulatory protein [Methylomicrobium sp.]